MDLTRELTAEEREWVEAWLPGLPMRIARARVQETLGGLVASKTLEKEDWAGTGPAVSWQIGDAGNSKVLYDTRSLLEWVVRRFGINPRRNLAALVQARTTSPRRSGARTGAGGRSVGSSRGSCDA